MKCSWTGCYAPAIGGALSSGRTSLWCSEHDLPAAPARIARVAPLPGYESLAAVLDKALEQAQVGKGVERHAGAGEAFEDQQIVQLGEWLGTTGFAIGQAAKKALESTRLPYDRALAELLGAINYLAAAAIQLGRREERGDR